MERNLRPIGPVIQFVPQLIHGFLDEKRIKQEANIPVVARPESCAGRNVEITFQECRVGPVRPETGPQSAMAEILLRGCDDAGPFSFKECKGSVME